MSSEVQSHLGKAATWVGIAAVSLGITHLIRQLSVQSTPKQSKAAARRNQSMTLRSLPSIAQIEEYEDLYDHIEQDRDIWSSLHIEAIDPQDGLLKELQLMTKIVCPFQKVSNLIADLHVENPKTYPCPLVAFKPKKHWGEPFLMPESLVTPGEFVIQNCVFRAGQSIEAEKKFMKAGPRSTQYFKPEDVKADIVCLGKVTPGINNVIRQLVVMLKETYKVDRVTGVRFSWQGYYNNQMIDLTPQEVSRIHHKGGSYLGLAKCKCDQKAIVDSLQRRGVNHLYMIGGNNTISNATSIYQEIKDRKLNIALCVCLKAINKDIAYFDNCFGFESAAEQTQRFIEEGYALSASNYNSVVLVKVPGRYSGFLAMDAVRAARNVNICLVPQFKNDLYGEKGLLQFIANRVEAKGRCIIVYSDGASFGFNDIPADKYHDLLLQKETTSQFAFDLFLRSQIESSLKSRGLTPHEIFFFDSQNAVRTVQANCFDAKLCSQIALCSIQGLMCGYTNFVIGHFRNRVAMVPLNQMNFAERYCLKVEDENWQRLLATTNQPSFSNDPQMV